MKHSFQSIDVLNKKPYNEIIGFPKATSAQIRRRIIELEKLGITKISFTGNTRLSTLNVIGKGYTGIVVLAQTLTKNNVAVKIRRVDSPRKDMKGESNFLKTANSVDVGPKFISSSKNFLVMEHLVGKRIDRWVNGNTINPKRHLKKILSDCFKLDSIGFDHGELSRITKHVIVGKKTTLIDFESSSMNRRPSNVTSATQGLFISPSMVKMIKKHFKVTRRDVIIRALQRYKSGMQRKDFDALIEVLKL